MNLPAIITALSVNLQPYLQYGVNAEALLYAICQNETRGGELGKFIRQEPNFFSKYIEHSNDPKVVRLRNLYGNRLAVSMGPFQVMPIVAYELDLDENDPPEILLNYEINVFYAVQILIKRSIPSATKFMNSLGKIHYSVSSISKDLHFVRSIADAYNSGNATDKIIPKKYMDDAEKWYLSFVDNKKRTLK